MLDTKYKAKLKEFISFKSISTDAVFIPEINKTVDWLEALFKENGFKVNVVRGYDNPLVVASYVVDPAYETCLVYGHYDVQPASKADGWDSEPFELTEKNGRLYARGSVDNKGQVFTHIYTVLELIKAKKLKYNVKFLLEGNEETGSARLTDFIKENKALLDADFVLLSDGEITEGHPTIELGFRGVLNSTITVTTSDRDLHSGLYGGTVPNAVHELVNLLDKFLSSRTIDIPGFYDSVETVPAKIKTQNKKLPFSLKHFQKITGTSKLFTEGKYDFYTQVGFRPSIEVTGIHAGYTADGYRNSIPATAYAKLNFRLTAEQDPVKIGKLFQNYIKNIAPKYLKVNVSSDQLSYGVKLDINNEYVERARKILKTVHKKEPLLKYCGATLPITYDFNKLFRAPQVLVPLVNEDCRMHATNENSDIKLIEKALKFSEMFFSK